MGRIICRNCGAEGLVICGTRGTHGCGGSGKSPYDFVACKYCGGTRYQECPICYGRGWL